MHTTTPAVDTRPIFLTRLSVRLFISFVTLSEKKRPGEEASFMYTQKESLFIHHSSVFVHVAAVGNTVVLNCNLHLPVYAGKSRGLL